MITKSWFLIKNLTLFVVRSFSRLLVYLTSLKNGEPLELFKLESTEAEVEEESFLALTSFR